MLRKQQLWLTHYSQVSDTKEIKLGIKIIQKELDGLFPKCKEEYLLNPLVNVLRHIPKQYYFMCFCPDSKNEHLWKEYANDGAGVAIGFNLASVGKKNESNEPYTQQAHVVSVEYGVEDFRKKVKACFSSMHLPTFGVIRAGYIKDKITLHNTPNYTNAQEKISEQVVLATMLKRDRYAREREFRLIHSTSMLHLELPIVVIGGKRRAVLDFPNGLPIESVVLGNNMKQRDINKISDAMKSAGYIVD